MKAEGAVAWSDRTGRVGIRFLNMKQCVRQILEKWLQTQFEQLLTKQKANESLVPSRPLATANRPLPPGV